ncbi:aldose epimerase family protein [Ruegeria arenilitoris]|uniref:aldose epimerase family protein n=1 Tax=Ruegeria arenilitoris TaxID=1173585 RepID=UPI0014802F65|nr:aldose epimerase family protein [Ruegeria arenilitoris]
MQQTAKRQPQAITISNGGLTATLMQLGAMLCDLRLEGCDHSLVLGWRDPAEYLRKDEYLGPIVGRCANRISSGAYHLNGETFHLNRNFRDRHCLHGGQDGASTQLWKVEHCSATSVTFTLHLPDGHMGFGGDLFVSARYSVENPAVLRLEIEAHSDSATVCNFAPHWYFNLNGGGDITGHKLEIAANRYLPVDDDLIPSGNPTPVQGTEFDFRTPRMVGDFPFDHNFCISDQRTPEKPVAVLESPLSGVRMALSSTEPGLQVYSGTHLNHLERETLSGEPYVPYSGLALEPQGWPDAPNNPSYPSVILRAGERYLHISRLSFNRSAHHNG